MNLKNFKNINLFCVGIFPISYTIYNYIKNINKKECYFCYTICIIDRNACFKCWKKALVYDSSNIKN